MRADAFLEVETLMILGLGLVAFMFDTFGGVLFAKIPTCSSRKRSTR